MASIDLLVSVAQEYRDQMPALIEQLEAVGMTNIESLAAVGVITGLLDESKIEEISRISGIAQVERSQAARIPPSGSEFE